MRNKETILSTLIVLIGIMVLSATTYSFLAITLNITNAQKAYISTRTVTLTFADGTDAFKATKISFGQSVTKTFVVSNNGNNEEKFHMYFKDLINTYVKGGLTYSLSFSSTQDGEYTPVVSNVNIPVGNEAMLRLVAGDLLVPANTTYYYKLTITYNNLTNVNQNSDLNAKLNTRFTITTGEILANHIEDLYSNNSTVINNGETYNTDNVNKLIDDNNGNIRYYGASPNNYVKFEDGTEWRIIGLFDTELADGTKQKTVKLVSSETIQGISYAITQNNWMGSIIRTTLNSDTKYNSIIQKVNLNIGSMGSANIYTNEMYEAEQAGSKVEGERKVLMYLSDYGYAADFNYCNKTIYGYSDASCTSNNWLYTSNSHQWSLNPVDGSGVDTDYVMLIVKSGAVFNNNGVSYPAGGRTVMFLDAGISYASGDGSEKNPYKINDSGGSLSSGDQEVDASTIFVTDGAGAVTGLTDYGKTLKNVTIPDEIDGVAITKVSEGFRGASICENSALETINLGKATIVGGLHGCANLKEVTGSYVEKVDYAAFAGSTNLTTVNMPNLIEIEMLAFNGCSSLKSITSNKVTKVGPVAFDGCTSLESIDLSSVQSMGGESVFYGCDSLTYIVLNKSFTPDEYWYEYFDSFEYFKVSSSVAPLDTTIVNANNALKYFDWAARGRNVNFIDK